MKTTHFPYVWHYGKFDVENSSYYVNLRKFEAKASMGAVNIIALYMMPEQANNELKPGKKGISLSSDQFQGLVMEVKNI